MQHEVHRGGYVALVGRPNVGKSTLLNRILGQKIAITSPKPQTTRNRILGILHRPDAQVMFLDTPGIHHAAGNKLNRYMVSQAHGAMNDVDCVMLLVEADRPVTAAEESVIRSISQSGRPALLVINKIDRVAPPALLDLIRRYSELHDFLEIVPVSALKGDGIEQLLDALLPHLPEGPPLYPEEMVTDQPERFIVAEMIREQVLKKLQKEIPYGTAVQIELFEDQPERDLVEIHAVIHVEREPHKRILVGKGGSMIRSIGQAARFDIERLLDTKVFLKLFVRVDRDWTRSDRLLREFGYE